MSNHIWTELFSQARHSLVLAQKGQQPVRAALSAYQRLDHLDCTAWTITFLSSLGLPCRQEQRHHGKADQSHLPARNRLKPGCPSTCRHTSSVHNWVFKPPWTWPMCSSGLMLLPARAPGCRGPRPVPAGGPQTQGKLPLGPPSPAP